MFESHWYIIETNTGIFITIEKHLIDGRHVEYVDMLKSHDFERQTGRNKRNKRKLNCYMDPLIGRLAILAPA